MSRMKTRFGRIILDLLVSAAILPVAPFAAAQNVPPDPNFLSVVVIEASDPEAAETGRDTGTFTVRRTAPTNLTLHVTYQTGGPARPGPDSASVAARGAAEPHLACDLPDRRHGQPRLRLRVVARARHDTGRRLGGHDHRDAHRRQPGRRPGNRDRHRKSTRPNSSHA